MARRMIHLCLDIRGGMAAAKDLCGCITVDGKTLHTVPEVKNFLQGQLDLGRRVLPMAECNNFDYQRGCLGHDVEEDRTMSYTEIYSFNREGFAERAGEVWNATRGAWAIWTTMEKRHLPPYTISGFTLSRLVRPDTAEEVWQLAVNKAVPEHERIVMLSTMDKCLVKKENLPKLIEAFRKFEGDTSLPEQADILEELLADDDCIAVGWNQTSVSCPIWYRFDEEKDEHIPYNCLTGTDHFWLFDDLNEED